MLLLRYDFARLGHLSVFELSQGLLSVGFFDIDIVSRLIDGADLDLPTQLIERVYLVKIVDYIR